MRKIQLKRKLATIAALLCLMTMMPLPTWAEVINTVTSSENLTRTSTVYVGEVVVDGVTKIKYLYSGDITTSSLVRQNLLAGLNGMADGDYAALLDGHSFDSSQTKGFAICSAPNLAADMDDNWSSAQYVGTLYFPDKSVSSEINSNLYDIDEGFRAAIDEQTADRMETIDTPADVEKCIVSYIGGNSTNNVYYTVEDGQIIKHVETYVVNDCEATTVIYTKVELGTASTLMGDVNEDGTVTITDVSLMVAYILGQQSDDFIEANADVNGDGSITVSDVTVLVEQILNGNGGNGGNDNPDDPDYPPYTLSCPDSNHPHMIDLGLPSGTKWACCNVGATTPEGFGGYYAWGETEEKNLDDYDFPGYKYSYFDTISDNYNCWYFPDLELYCHLKDIGSNICGTLYDVAHIKWGDRWHMPTHDQIVELIDNTIYYKSTSINGVKGGLFTSRTNGASIFLPNADFLEKDYPALSIGSEGYYLTGTLYPRFTDDGIDHGITSAWALSIYDNSTSNNDTYCVEFEWTRPYGASVRPVWVP